MRASAFTLRPATPDDTIWLVPRLRERDRQEALATFEDLDTAIRHSISASPICDVAEIDGVGIFVIGCAPDANVEGRGIPWLLATTEVAHHPGALTKITKHYVGLFLERWPVLLNFVDERNVTSVRWLRRLGFTVCEPLAFGKNGEPFHPFVMGV